MTDVHIIKALIGGIFKSVENRDNQELVFIGDETFKFYHIQNCCETVNIEDIEGDLSDLENYPILVAEEVTKESNKESDSADGYSHDRCSHETWTFYKFRTIKGSVTVRWYGESNGYYSEDVDFKRVKDD